MKKLIEKRSTTLALYAIISVLILLLSFLLMFAKIWEVHACLFISTVMNVGYLSLILFWGVNKNSKTSVEKPGSMALFTILRTLCELISIFLCALVMYFFPSKVFANNEKLQFLFVLVALVPHAIALYLCMAHSKVEA